MDIKDYISLILFLIFIFSYLAKLLILKNKYSIQANVLAKAKIDFKVQITEALVKLSTFLWGVLWFSLSVSESLISDWSNPLVSNDLFSSLGILVIALGLAVFIVAMISMKTSWRVGIDKGTKSSLVTEGIYRFTRNPAFVGFDLMFIGLFLTYPYILTFGIVVLNILAIHCLILQEEKHLKTTFNEEYLKYFSNTKRYIVF